MTEPLPTRQMNALRVLLNKHDFEPKEVAHIDIRILMRASGIGHKGLAIIRHWLAQYDCQLEPPQTRKKSAEPSRKIEQAIHLLRRHGYRVYRPAQPDENLSR